MFQSFTSDIQKFLASQTFWMMRGFVCICSSAGVCPTTADAGIQLGWWHVSGMYLYFSFVYICVFDITVTSLT